MQVSLYSRTLSLSLLKFLKETGPATPGGPGGHAAPPPPPPTTFLRSENKKGRQGEKTKVFSSELGL